MASLTNSSTFADIKDIRMQYKSETRSTSGLDNTGERIIYHCHLAALVFDLVRKYSNAVMSCEGGGGGVGGAGGDSEKDLQKKSRDTCRSKCCLHS
jgi:hypothetical protein